MRNDNGGEALFVTCSAAMDSKVVLAVNERNIICALDNRSRHLGSNSPIGPIQTFVFSVTQGQKRIKQRGKALFTPLTDISKNCAKNNKNRFKLTRGTSIMFPRQRQISRLATSDNHVDGLPPLQPNYAVILLSMSAILSVIAWCKSAYLSFYVEWHDSQSINQPR